MRGEAAGRVDVEHSRKGAMGASNAGAMGGGIDRVRSTVTCVA